jgi:uncharacterized protein with beta-barrel porin domain
MRARLMAGVSLAAVGLGSPAVAQNIDTISQWNGTSFISSWGATNTATYGQTITATNLQSKLTSFTFELTQSGPPPNYQAFVYQWDPTNRHITGPALFTSGPLVAPTTPNINTYVPVTINTGAVQLVAGQQYVLFFTTSSQTNPITGSAYRYGALTNDTAYGGGRFVFINNGSTNTPADFAALDTTSWSFINEDLAFRATFIPVALASLLPAGAPINPTNVATAIDGFALPGGQLPAGFQTLYGLSGGQLLSALSQLSGESNVDGRQAAFMSMNMFLSLMTNPFFENRGGSFGPALGFAPDAPAALPPAIASAYASVLKAPALPAPSPFRAWGAAYGGTNATRGDPVVVGSNDFNARAIGFAAGVDYRVSPDTLIGAALASGVTSWQLNNGFGGGNADVLQAGVYGSHQMGAAYVSGALAFANFWTDTSRIITFAGTDMVKADFDAWSVGGRLEGGYRFGLPMLLNLTPYAAVQGQQYHMPGFAETTAAGANPFGLNVSGQDAHVVRGELGSWFSKGFALDGGMSVAWFGRLAWAHDAQTGRALTSVFQGLPGASFVVNGAAAPTDLALVTVGAEWRIAGNVSVLGRFDGEFGNNSQTYTGTARFRFSW